MLNGLGNSWHEFTWRDGERLIRFGPNGLDEFDSLAAARGLHDFTLLTTGHGRDLAPAFVERAINTIDVPPGRVDEIAAEILGKSDPYNLIAFGGGRVIDVAKALAGVLGVEVAAIPTTLSGAEMSGYHRLPAGQPGKMVRPSLVVAVPELMASQPVEQLTASAMNALGHAIESLYAPLTNPVAEVTALRGIEDLVAGLDAIQEVGAPDRPRIALGATLAGYAIGLTGTAIHHAICQTIVRITGSPHAETNAVILPQIVRLIGSRRSDIKIALASAMTAQGDPADRLTALCRINNVPTTLSEIGVNPSDLDEIVAAAAGRKDLTEGTPGGADVDTVRELLQMAL